MSRMTLTEYILKICGYSLALCYYWANKNFACRNSADIFHSEKTYSCIQDKFNYTTGNYSKLSCKTSVS